MPFQIPNEDYLTIKYDSTGVEQWIAMFNGNGNATDNPIAMAISQNGNVYVIGSSYNGFNYDIATVKYSQCPSTANALRYAGTNNEPNNSTTNETIVQTPYNGGSQPSPASNEYVTMFPNPNDGNFYFNYSLPENEKCKFAIYDQIGKKVYDIEIKSGKNTVMVNHDNFSNGVYYYQVIAGNRLIKTERLVIAK